MLGHLSTVRQMNSMNHSSKLVDDFGWYRPFPANDIYNLAPDYVFHVGHTFHHLEKFEQLSIIPDDCFNSQINRVFSDGSANTHYLPMFQQLVPNFRSIPTCRVEEKIYPPNSQSSQPERIHNI